MPPVGPIYCETPLAAFSFPAEPINFYTNAFIVAFGLIALLYAYRNRVTHDLWVLAGLLTATGVGSFLWHGFRTPLTLTLDVMPGLFFLFVFVYAWARRLWGTRGAGLFFASFLVLTFPAAYLVSFLVPISGPPLGVVVAVIVAGLYLVHTTERLYGSVLARLGLASILAALTAFAFRSVDLAVCAYIPFGTHFLWHLFLSGGAFLGFYLLLKIDQAREPNS